MSMYVCFNSVDLPSPPRSVWVTLSGRCAMQKQKFALSQSYTQSTRHPFSTYINHRTLSTTTHIWSWASLFRSILLLRLGAVCCSLSLPSSPLCTARCYSRTCNCHSSVLILASPWWDMLVETSPLYENTLALLIVPAKKLRIKKVNCTVNSNPIDCQCATSS